MTDQTTPAMTSADVREAWVKRLRSLVAELSEWPEDLLEVLWATDEAKRLVAILDRAALASTPAPVNVDQLREALEATFAVVCKAWCAVDDSSDDFNPATHAAVPLDSLNELTAALDAAENLVPEGSQYVGPGALAHHIREWLAALASMKGPEAS